MSSPTPREAHRAAAARQFARVTVVVRLVVVAVVAAVTLRTLVAEPFSVPTPSMLPTLAVGDTLIVAKWPYGFGRFSAPFPVPGLTARIAGHSPERGDVIVFKTPADNRTDFIKRVIGVPGDRVAMAAGRISINGVAIPRLRVADFTAFGDGCPPGQSCRFPQFVEQLGRHRYAVLHVLDGGGDDDVAPLVVPPGHFFVLGDNRDDSADSRLSVAAGGVGLVPAANLIGRAEVVVWAARRERIGARL